MERLDRMEDKCEESPDCYNFKILNYCLFQKDKMQLTSL